MNDIDIMILRLLMKNCRMSYEEIARKINVSATTIKKHVSLLNKTGVIKEYLVDLCYSILGAFSFLSLVRTEGNEDRKIFMDELGFNPFIERVSCLDSGLYLIEGVCIGVNNLLNQDNFFRNHPMVNSYKIHIPKQKEKIDIKFKRMDLELLKLLLQNPRISISSLSSNTGWSLKSVRKTLGRLQREPSVLFTINPCFHYYFGQLKLGSDTNYETVSFQLDRYKSKLWKSIYCSDDMHLFLPSPISQEIHFTQFY